MKMATWKTKEERRDGSWISMLCRWKVGGIVSRLSNSSSGVEILILHQNIILFLLFTDLCHCIQNCHIYLSHSIGTSEDTFKEDSLWETPCFLP